MEAFVSAFIITFFLCWLLVPACRFGLKLVNVYTTVYEGHAKVYLLFGRVLGVVDEPNLHLLWAGPAQQPGGNRRRATRQK
jgi:hypothetical protein